MIPELQNTRYKVSLYSNLFEVKQPSSNLDVNEIIEIVKYGYLKAAIDKIRKAKTRQEYSFLKNNTLPCITTSGEFGYRNSAGLVKHSGLIQVDIDMVSNYDSLFDSLCKDAYTYLCFRSPGGKGIKVVVKINPSAETHLLQFLALSQYFKNTYTIDIDKACKDISRLMLLSYDPNIYCNPHAHVYKEVHQPPPRIKLKRVDTMVSKFHFDPIKQTEAIIAEIESRHIDITSPYENWVKVGFALTNEFGEAGREYFHRISQFHEEYDQSTCDKKYTQLLKSPKTHNSLEITIATLILLARNAGIN